jgi:calcium binding protein 39
MWHQLCFVVQSLKLLHDILLEKRNVHVMFQYVKSKRHLMLVMNLLRSSSKSIQYEAFHVFKVFVANPKKPREIRGILIGNREKLLRFLKQFLVERGALPIIGCV